MRSALPQGSCRGSRRSPRGKRPQSPPEASGRLADLDCCPTCQWSVDFPGAHRGIFLAARRGRKLRSARTRYSCPVAMSVPTRTSTIGLTPRRRSSALARFPAAIARLRQISRLNATQWRLSASIERPLPSAQRQVLLLHCVQGLKYEEVAAHLGLPLGTVQSRISRARTSLRAMIAKPNSGLGLANHATAPRTALEATA
jgi:RNA polymerase sigma factor (sigma-70 family)